MPGLGRTQGYAAHPGACHLIAPVGDALLKRACRGRDSWSLILGTDKCAWAPPRDASSHARFGSSGKSRSPGVLLAPASSPHRPMPSGLEGRLVHRVQGRRERLELGVAELGRSTGRGTSAGIESNSAVQAGAVPPTERSSTIARASSAQLRFSAGRSQPLVPSCDQGPPAIHLGRAPVSAPHRPCQQRACLLSVLGGFGPVEPVTEGDYRGGVLGVDAEQALLPAPSLVRLGLRSRSRSSVAARWT